MFLPLYGRLKPRSNQSLLLRLLPPFWNFTADSLFQNCGLMVLNNLDADWLLLAYIFGETRVILTERCRFLSFSISDSTSLEVVSKFRKFSLLLKLCHHVGNTSSFQESGFEVWFFYFLHLSYGANYFYVKNLPANCSHFVFDQSMLVKLRNSIDLFKYEWYISGIITNLNSIPHWAVCAFTEEIGTLEAQLIVNRYVRETLGLSLHVVYTFSYWDLRRSDENLLYITYIGKTICVLKYFSFPPFWSRDIVQKKNLGRLPNAYIISWCFWAETF